MKTIIVPTDFSANATNATEYAVCLAKKMEAKLILVHVFQRPTLLSTSLEIYSTEELKKQHLEKLSVVVEKLHLPPQVQVEKIVTTGDLAEVLPELVKMKSADLVVMGMQGISFAEQVLVGSVTASVLQQADFPVLVVPIHAKFQPFKNIIFACEYHYLSGHNMLVPLREIALNYGAEVQVLHIEQPMPDQEILQERVGTGHHLEKVFKGVKHHYTFLKGGDISKGIEKEMQKSKADMLVMVPRKHGVWDTIFNRSTTRKMALLTQIPLLSLPNPQ